jgi:hypothetical protein
MFTESKYTKIYYSIITRAKSRAKLTCYTEKHHIVPKSLGGSNLKDNLVTLTAKEHFLCHKLLVKMTTGTNKNKMSYALWAMATLNNPNQKRYKILSSDYERLRILRSNALSDTTKGKNNPNFGKKTGRTSKDFTDEWKKNLSDACKGRTPWNQGITHSDETKKLMSTLAKNRDKKECPHCHKLIAGPSNFSRWHGNNCKNLLTP